MSSPPGVPPSLDGCAPRPDQLLAGSSYFTMSVPLALPATVPLPTTKNSHPPTPPHLHRAPFQHPPASSGQHRAPSPPPRSAGRVSLCPPVGRVTFFFPRRQRQSPRRLHLPRVGPFPNATMYTRSSPDLLHRHHPHPGHRHLPLYLCHEALHSS